MSEAKYEESVVPIGEMLPGDEVLSSSGEWIKARLLPIQTKPMYRVLTTAGAVDCSFDHQWRLIEKRPLEGDLEVSEGYLDRVFVNTENRAGIKEVSEGLRKYAATHGAVKEYEDGAVVLSAVEIFNEKEKYIGWDIGLAGSGVELVGVEMLEEGKCRCLEVDSEDHQFVILAERECSQGAYLNGKEDEAGGTAETEDTMNVDRSGCIPTSQDSVGRKDAVLLVGEGNDNGSTMDIKRERAGVCDGGVAKLELLPVLSHNCATRLIAGKLGSIASGMALGDSSATTVDGTHKGAGIVSVNGEKTNIQYYFAEENTSAGISWINDWYRDHGMDTNGFPIGESLEVDLNDVPLGDDLEEFSLSDSDQHFEFEDTTKDIINRKDQHFEEI